MLLIIGILNLFSFIFWIPYVLLFIHFSNKEDENPENLAVSGYYRKIFAFNYKMIPILVKFMLYVAFILIAA